ncbi:hypothetical protein BCL57_000345 [Agromyces flavus]|uniref:Uncharacterized protein n=1 Tax=Agromyces flavus TaxID=589382 RepID=A0A1H1WLH0_9MICO|nr:hypothetical protein [Agromyces flavus]MCP2366203.1 hypothetical protein [Agromyces flavus]GGI44204.1 hypothetical protein GCM10010932_03440 [Agromyces flavus]SDS98003.1 hypothetical protein SAMN04489721_2273 [Agromyces flavus]
MTDYRTMPESTPLARESKITLLGTALMLVMGALVIGSGVVLVAATILLGDSAFDLP